MVVSKENISCFFYYYYYYFIFVFFFSSSLYVCSRKMKKEIAMFMTVLANFRRSGNVQTFGISTLALIRSLFVSSRFSASFSSPHSDISLTIPYTFHALLVQPQLKPSTVMRSPSSIHTTCIEFFTTSII